MSDHVLTIDTPVYYPGEGFLLGNGDISVSIFTRNEDVVIKLGKNDLWDSRLNLDGIPRPADINELRELIAGVNFCCDGPSGKLNIANLDNPRLVELCTKRGLTGTSPNPKPAAELILHTCGDLRGMRVSQSLYVEKGALDINISWQNNISLALKIAVDPEKNVMAIRWSSANYTSANRFGGSFYGIPQSFLFYFELKCQPEKSAFEQSRSNLPHIITNGMDNSNPTTEALLEPAKYSVADNAGMIFRQFPDRELAISAAGCNLNAVADTQSLLFFPENNCESGTFAAGWEVDALPDIKNVKNDGVFFAAETAAEKFFAVSKVGFQDKMLDDIYHAAMHVKRSVFKAGKFPPGLILASTVNDYSPWHGDYHLNYNYQSSFLGDFSAGHFDTGDAFFTGLEPLLKLGRKIAKDYYHCRGCFVQLSGFPFDVADDYMGNLPFGRMAYMTGWVAAWFYRRWELSGDRQWLIDHGYSAIRDFALFYTDFLTLEDDGYFHAFPSNQGEENYTREGTRDQVQVLRHARSALIFALKCAAELDCDRELQATWQNILDKLVPIGELPPYMAAEFAGFDGLAPECAADILKPGCKFYDWYPGQMPYFMMTALRNGLCSPADHKLLVSFMKRWMLPNYLMQAMASVHYGHPGYWSESLGIAGVLQDMLAVNCAGVLKFFSGVDGDAEFGSLRLDGGFICSAGKNDGAVKKITIRSLHRRIIQIELPENFNGKAAVKNPDGTSEIFYADNNCRVEMMFEPGEEKIFSPPQP